MLHSHFKGATRVLQKSYKNVTRVLEGCYNGVTYFNKGVVMVFYCCFNECYLSVTKVFYGRHNVVTLLFQWCDMQECHIRSDMSIVTRSDKSRVTSQGVRLKSGMSRVTSFN